MELNPKSIPDYIHEQLEIGVFSADAEIAAKEIRDGNLNFVFRVYDVNEPTNSIVLKQAPPYIKILGPNYELTPDRLTYESRALKVYNRLVPEYSPNQIHFHPQNYVIAMEDLKDYHILRFDLIEGKVNPCIPEHIARFMAITHSRTHADNLRPNQIEDYTARFDNHVMQSITADYIFTKPFITDSTNFYTEGLEAQVNALKGDQQLLSQIGHLKKIFLGAKQGLTHGDLHTGSVMVQGDSAKVIDSEFVFYGPVGFDMGLYWANYLLSYFSHVESTPVREKLKTAIQRTWDIYETEFEMDDGDKKAAVLKRVFHESVGFTVIDLLFTRICFSAPNTDSSNEIVSLLRKSAPRTPRESVLPRENASPNASPKLPNTLRPKMSLK